MNIKLTLHVLGSLLMSLGVALLFPIPVSLYYSDGATYIFLISAAVTLVAGAICY